MAVKWDFMTQFFLLDEGFNGFFSWRIFYGEFIHGMEFIHIAVKSIVVGILKINIFA